MGKPMKVKIKWVLFIEKFPEQGKSLLVWRSGLSGYSVDQRPAMASYIGDGVFLGPAGHKVYSYEISHWSYFDVPEPKGKAND